MLVSFLTVSALYRADLDAETKTLYWQAVGGYLIFGTILDYFTNLIAFGYNSKTKKAFILDTCICLFIWVGYAVKKFGAAMSDQSN